MALYSRSSVCQEDWLEIYNQYRDGTEILLGRYCGMTAPGPIESAIDAIGIKIILHADQENVASGFKARYTFEVSNYNIYKYYIYFAFDSYYVQ